MTALYDPVFLISQQSCYSCWCTVLFYVAENGLSYTDNPGK